MWLWSNKWNNWNHPDLYSSFMDSSTVLVVLESSKLEFGLQPQWLPLIHILVLSCIVVSCLSFFFPVMCRGYIPVAWLWLLSNIVMLKFTFTTYPWVYTLSPFYDKIFCPLGLSLEICSSTTTISFIIMHVCHTTLWQYISKFHNEVKKKLNYGTFSQRPHFVFQKIWIDTIRFFMAD